MFFPAGRPGARSGARPPRRSKTWLSRLRVAPAPGLRSLIDRWGSRIDSLWAATHPSHVVFLLPEGRRVFTEGGRDAIVFQVKLLAARLAKMAADIAAAAQAPGLDPALAAELAEQSATLATLAAGMGNFHATLAAARVAQIRARGQLKKISIECEQARGVAAAALYRVLIRLIDRFPAPGERGQVTSFFDMMLLSTARRADDDEEPGDEAPAAPAPAQG